MKTTLELPDELMRSVKVRAARTDRKLKDVVTELIELGLEASEATPAASDPLHAWLEQLVPQPDGSFLNPGGIDDPAFLAALEEMRADALRDPFAAR